MRKPLVTVKIQTRKRKKSSPSLAYSNPFTSVFTRSKSRIFHHQNRSGFSRTDRLIRVPTTDMESVETFLGVNRRGASRILLAKDLRHKRVFSPGVDSVPDQENEETNDERKKLLKGFDSSTVRDVDDVKDYELGKCGIVDERIAGANGPKWTDEAIPGNGSLPNMKMALNGCHRKKVFKTPSSFSYRRLLPHLMDIVNDTTSVSKIELVDAGSPCKFPKLDGVDFELRSTADNSSGLKTEYFESKFNDSKKDYIEASTIQPNLSSSNNELAGNVKEKDHKNDMNGVDPSVEENIQTTPPDSDILARTEVGHGRESEDAKKVLGENQMSMGLSVGSEKSINGALKQSPNSKCSTSSISKSVVNPCSRLRLFKNPRSLSYRRLLPFLMDISKTDSCTSRKPQQKIPEVVYQEDRLPAPAARVENNYMNNTTKENSCEKIYTEDMIQTASDGSSPDSNNNPVSLVLEGSANYSSNIDPRSDNSPTLSDLGSQADLAKLQLDLRSKESCSVSEPSSVVSYFQTEQCTSGEFRSVEKQNMCSSTGLEVHNGNTESTEMVDLKQHSIQTKKTDALICPDNRSFKGILKRNRRGCRGLCNCLTCASFRLHAERAFEFSRNQLQDAEEVASELMKELANLRLLLEKTINGKDDSASIQPYPVIIKEACNKAIEAETLAKERLVELNSDLSAHCRIPDLLQPKVTFAYNTQ